MNHDPLISALQQDLLLNILSHSEDIGKCASMITTQIREIIGARLVALFENTPDGERRLIGACPERRKDMFDRPDLASLRDLSDAMRSPALIRPGQGDIGQILRACGMGSSFVIPLRVGAESFGVLLLLDIMDERGIEGILGTLTDLSGLLSLILKNSFLFRNLERLVEQRTAALIESETRSRLILQVALDGFVISDAEGQILDVNDAYCRITGFSRNELMQMTLEQIDVNQSDEDIRTRMKKILSGSMDRFETRHIRKNGGFAILDVTAQTLPGSDDQVFAFIRDITDQKKSEKEQASLKEQLVQAQKMESVGRLAGGVAHDFNNMLGVILGHTELAMDQVDPGHVLESDLCEIRKAAQRSADLTRQLLAFARKQTISPKVLKLDDAVTGTLFMIRRLIGEGVVLSFRSEVGLWPVRMDPSQVDQILANLCINARDAVHGSGQIRIETTNCSYDEGYCTHHPDHNPGDFVCLSVSDNGSGIDRETLDHIFEPFFTTKPQGQGTGLGLATVYGIVKQNKGFIVVDSGPDQGTAFRIHLPREEEPEPPFVPACEETTAESGQGTVLLVEDEPSMLSMVKTMLESMGYKVLSAASPSEAIRLAREHGKEIHVLMTDVIMPEINGPELADRLTADNPGLKRIFMSGYTANLIARQGSLIDETHFLRKPFMKKDLAEKMRLVFQDAQHSKR
ncbi:hypothetical protein JCM14469_10880 [Desulfatiferula olefinivorans]